jgi:chromosome segregation ATPase
MLGKIGVIQHRSSKEISGALDLANALAVLNSVGTDLEDKLKVLAEIGEAQKKYEDIVDQAKHEQTQARIDQAEANRLKAEADSAVSLSRGAIDSLAQERNLFKEESDRRSKELEGKEQSLAQRVQAFTALVTKTNSEFVASRAEITGRISEIEARDAKWAVKVNELTAHAKTLEQDSSVLNAHAAQMFSFLRNN